MSEESHVIVYENCFDIVFTDAGLLTFNGNPSDGASSSFTLILANIESIARVDFQASGELAARSTLTVTFTNGPDD